MLCTWGKQPRSSCINGAYTWIWRISLQLSELEWEGNSSHMGLNHFSLPWVLGFVCWGKSSTSFDSCCWCCCYLRGHPLVQDGDLPKLMILNTTYITGILLLRHEDHCWPILSGYSGSSDRSMSSSLGSHGGTFTALTEFTEEVGINLVKLSLLAPSTGLWGDAPLW